MAKAIRTSRYPNLVTKQLGGTNKYGAKPTVIDNIRFASKKEAEWYMKFKNRQSVGDIKSFIMQIPFRLPGKSVHRIDFMVINHDNTVEFIECKGFRAPIGELKRKQTEELYGINIKVV